MKKHLGAHLSTQTGLAVEKVIELLEIPKDISHGDLAFPCFQISKLQKKAPHIIAQELSKIKPPVGFIKSEAVGGYLNFFFEDHFWQKTVFGNYSKQQEDIGNINIGNNQIVVFDYSSPNVAKPMSIGHLRSTVIGESLNRIYKSCGFKTIAINYIGDWGVQFGKLAWSHINLKELLGLAKEHTDAITSKDFDKNYWNKLLQEASHQDTTTFNYLFAIYVIFHAVAQLEPKLEDYGREYFLKLEKRKSNQDELTLKIVSAWQKFIKISINEYEHVYKLLGTKHDLVRGESFYEDHLKEVILELEAKKLLKLSQGANIVDLEAFNMPPCLIQKSDGATLYATRDIAAAINRVSEFNATQLIYVVGAEQSLHFKQFFKVLELMGYEWVKNCHHVAFGLYRFKEGKMSTRRGNVILLEDVLARAIDLVKNIIKEKNPNLKNADQVANNVGVGAITFNDLMNDRQKNIDFDWDKILDFNGDTGPYVQYTHVRCCSVLSKYNKELISPEKLEVLTHPLEKNLINIMGRFEEVVKLSYEQLKPSWIAQYSLELAKAFNSFYYEIKILDGEQKLQGSRVFLVNCVRLTLLKALYLLGIRAPESM
ncbi:MAG: arginine--tRNA ligase [Oligoflexia bacterium]|nr:arginine--tRNA ligase [Oligoflexia bacterium]